MKTAEDRSNLYQWWEGTIAKMMNYGMFYFTKANIQTYKNIIEMELCSICFYYRNLLSEARPLNALKYVV